MPVFVGASHPKKAKTESLGEIVPSGTMAGNSPDEPGTFCSARQY